MANATRIGRTSFVRGRLSGEGDLEIAGRVEGDIAVTGDVLVDATGLVAANISGARVVVRGAIKGDLAATEALVLEAGARVVGDLRSPRIAIAQGALVRGQVEAGGQGAARPKATSARGSVMESRPRVAMSPAMSPVARSASVSAPVTAPMASPSRSAAAPAAPAMEARAAAKPALGAARKAPPAPVVPVLKKGTKALQKKRA